MDKKNKWHKPKVEELNLMLSTRSGNKAANKEGVKGQSINWKARS